MAGHAEGDGGIDTCGVYVGFVKMQVFSLELCCFRVPAHGAGPPSGVQVLAQVDHACPPQVTQGAAVAPGQATLVLRVCPGVQAAGGAYGAAPLAGQRGQVDAGVH